MRSNKSKMRFKSDPPGMQLLYHTVMPRESIFAEYASVAEEQV